MGHTDRHDLREVLLAARALLARARNDFTWSGWDDTADALAEIDGSLATLDEGAMRKDDVGFLFLPTGPLQETALSSGWGEAFLALAERFDALPDIAPDLAAADACADRGSLRRVTLDVRAIGFPRALDGNPLLGWMGEDWVSFVTRAMVEELQGQDPGTRVRSVRCEEDPALETCVGADGAVTGARVALALAVELRSGAGEEWLLRGAATFAPGSRAFAIEESIRTDVPDPEVLIRQEWTCVSCGGEAGAVELRLGNVLRREGPGSALLLPLADEEMVTWRGVLERGDAIVLHAADPEVASFWCPQCRAPYCSACWRLLVVFDDEGFSDCVRGTCPEGHERMLED